MIVLGIHGGVTLNQHEPSACLIVNGEIVAAVEEERYNRIKSSYGLLPKKSIDACLRIGKIKITDVDLVVSTGITYSEQNIRLESFLSHNFGFSPPVKLVHHQDAHLATSFYSSEFEESLSFSIDASGDGDCNHLAIMKRNQEMKLIDSIPSSNSLGMFYTLMTHFLGFEDGDEYKVMGLAPYGKPSIDLSDILKINESGWLFDNSFLRKKPKLMSPFEPMYSQKLIELLGKSRNPNDPILKNHEDLAASTQYFFERAFLSYCSFIKHRFPEQKNLCLSGGAALNCSANGKLFESQIFENIYIPPMPSDRGLSIGCAYLGSETLGSNNKPLFSPYLGESYSQDSIINELKSNGIKFEVLEDVSTFCAKQIAKGKILGWYQGKSEIGARALGNRSILASPLTKEMQEIVNEKIKFREKFRPFAPIILFEEADKYFEANNKKHPFMSIVLKVKDKLINNIPAVVHIDKTARVQTIEKETNPKIYKLINEFKNITGIPVLLNTSFNLKGEPIVESPRDAIRTFYGSGMDILVLENVIVKK